MVAIFTGAGTGFERGSGSKLGSSGLLGSAGFGRSGEQIFLNAANGNLLISQRDEFLVGRGPDAGVNRTYNSLGNQSDDNGDNWRQSTQRAVSLNGTANSWGSSVTHQLGDGSEIVYYWTGSAYVTTEGGGVHDKITWDGSVFRWTDGDTGTVETYAAGGPSPWYRLSTVSDTSGNTLTYGYTGDKLTSLTTANGETLTYTWSGNHITEVNSGDGTLTRYYYDGYDRLSRVDAELTGGGAVYSTYYSYHGSSKLVATISETDGSYLAIGYDGANRVTSLSQTVAAGNTRTTSIAYGVDYTVVTDPAGQATTLHYNYLGALTQITAPPASAGAAPQTVKFAYDEDGNLTAVTDPAGQTTNYTRDSWGNVLVETDRLDNFTQRLFGPGNKLLIETRLGSGSTRYAYDSANRLVYTVSAEGRVTRNWYNGYGQLYFISEFPDNLYDLSGLTAEEPLSQSQLDSWCTGLGDTSSAVITYLSYDARGNMIRRMQASASSKYSVYDGMGGERDEHFTYDSAGRLLSRYVLSQNTESFVYDGLGRVVASTDLNGGTTSIVFNDAATQTVVTLGNGLTETSTYNKAGELVSYTKFGPFVTGTAIGYQYDKNGRARIYTDASGNKTYYLYDKAGRKVADIDANGGVTEYWYDLNNRLIGTVRYANAATGSGTLAALGDPNNSLELASIRPSSHSYDLWTWSVYDKEGRLIEAIEGDGSVTAYEYDASGRLVKTTGYANKLSSGQLDAFKVNGPSAWLPAAHAKDSVARIFYDRDGRKIGALDGEGYLTRTIYDGAGRKVREIAYANITNAALRASGSFQGLIDSAGTSASDRSVRYVYDGQNLLRFTIDALGQVTEYGYGSISVAIGLVRQTVRYAGTLGTLSSYSYASVKSAVAALASDPANRTSWAVYDNAGRLAYAIDAAGAVVGYSYDTRGQMVRKAEYATARPTGSLPSLGDMDAWASGTTTANDRITRYYYNATGELRYTVDAEGYITGNDYDGAGRVRFSARWDTPVSANDSWTIYTVDGARSGQWAGTNSYYDANGRLTFTTTNEGQSRRFYYYATGLLAWDILSEGGQDDSRTYYVYDAAGRKASVYVAYGTAEQAITTYAYNGLGDLVGVSDPNAHSTGFEYDHAGRVIRQTNAYGSPTVFEYNAFGEVTRTINARGLSTYSYYDQAGRVTSVVDALNYATTTSYTVFGEVASVTRAGATTSFGYDKLGRVVTTTDAEGGVETSGYDAFGNRIRFVNKLGGVTEYSYNRRGLLAEEKVQAILDGSGNVVTAGFSRNRYEYDARGNVVHRIEAYGLAEQRDTWFAYDKANRLTSKWGEAVAVGLSPATVTPTEYYRYDTRGNLVETIDANGARTLVYYDDLDRKVATVVQTGSAGNPQGLLSTFAYDPGGNLIRSRTWAAPVALPGAAGGTPPAPADGNYRETVNSYDNLDRLKTSSITGQSYGYWNGSSYVYATGATLTTSYDYDVVGNVVRTTGPDGVAVYSYYDVLDRKIAQVDGGSYATSWSYDAEGNVLSERRYAVQASGVSTSGYSASTSAADRVTEFSYDRMGRRLTEARSGVEAWSLNAASGQLSGASGTSLIRYTYNALGQVKSKTEATGDVTLYSYDNAGRLIQEARPGFSGVTPTVRYQYNGLGQLIVTRQGDASLQAGDRITTNLYDGAGRLTGTVDALGQTRSYVYDAAGRKLGETYSRALGDAAGTLVTEGISYQYDLAGNVIRQAVNTVSGGSWSEVSYTQMAYNAFGEITARGTNGGWQEQFRYDNGGRLTASNAGDGVWRIHGYDQAGRQTLSLESDGATDLSGMSQADAIGRIAGGTVTASATVYDGRGQAIQAVQVLRRTAADGAAQNIATGRGYTAFGELAWETDAYGRRTDYSYNSMGRVTQIERPSVSVTAENGTVSSLRPTERMFYDIAGRLIGTQDANSVQSGSGVKTTRQLLAGTGYGDAAALVLKEWHPDGGAISNGYDVFGDQASATDEIGRTTYMAYDKLGRLTQVTRPGTAAGALVESYAYDVLGQRIGRWNNVVGYAGRERTQYDALGRMTLQVAYGGDATTTSYAWDGGMATSGMGGFGGWVTTTSTDADRASASDDIYAAIQHVDIFGRVAARSDKGGQAYGYQYDRLGRIVAETSTLYGVSARNLSYSYYNTGQVRQVLSGDAPVANSNWDRKVASYEYDLLGQLTRETLVSEAGKYKEGGFFWFPDPGNSPDTPEGEGQGHWELVPPSYTVETRTLQDGRANYDAGGRITRYRDTIAPGVDAVDKSWTYDAAGNVRSIVTSYLPMQANGALASTATPQSWWYRYDSMNRLVTTKGIFIGAPGSGSIQRGDAGTDISYDATGARASAQTGSNAQEVYAYDAAGQLVTVVIGGMTRAQTGYDLLGRVTSYAEYDGWGMGVHSRYDIVYDPRGLVLAEKSSTRQGSDWIYTHTANYYSATGAGAAGPAIGWAGQTGSASGSLLYYSETKNWKNGGTPVYGGPGSYSQADLDYADSYTRQSYEWREGARQALVQLVNRDGTSSSSYDYDRDGGLSQVVIAGGARSRTIAYRSDLQGQVLYRYEADSNWWNSEPATRTYRFGGRQMGVVSNDGTSNVDYAASIDARTAVPGNGAFRNGAAGGTVFADFDANFTALNGGTMGGASSYVANGGETLQSIAAQLWGDANLWYKLAEANPGLSAGGALGGGTALTVPGGVVGNRHDATTFRPYDPAEAIGNTSPNTPNPPQKGNRCGTLGAIVMVAIAVAVTMLTRVPFAKLFAGMGMGSAVGAGGAVLAGTTSIGLTSTAAIAGGVAAGVAGSVASQAFGVAARLQDGISWKGVALAGISAGVSGGLAGGFETIAGSAFLGDVVRGALGSVVSQGIGVATRLQD
ncbi:hypothetical protein OMP43_20425, partial [Sphingomonas sp. CBMAI 2297]|uniref:hypothetical protein n=1 Tax=Sphingomonas sp. CBMAI 2297 TaxID=2991720 RepID=UPI0024575C47